MPQDESVPHISKANTISKNGCGLLGVSKIPFHQSISAFTFFKAEILISLILMPGGKEMTPLQERAG
jgi:hypothetical protein